MGRDKILITGATGFIGRHLCVALGNVGISLRVLSRDRRRAAGTLASGIEIVEGDLCDAETLIPAAEGVTCVFHLAAEIASSALMRKTNVEGTANLIRALQNTGVKRLIYLSSAGVAGQRDYRYIDEKTPCLPDTEYERTKLEAEEIVRRFSVASGVPASIVRPTIVFGEGNSNRGDSFYQLLRYAKRRRYFLLDNGSGTANYVYVGDVVNALVALYKDTRPGLHIYFLNDETSMRTLSMYAGQAIGISSQPASLPYAPVIIASRVISAIVPSFPLTPYRVRAMHSPYHYSCERIKQDLGFKFEFGLKEGISRTVRWLDAQGWLA